MDSSLSRELVDVSVAVIVVMTLVVALRTGVRVHLEMLGADDYLIVASWVFLMANCCVVAWATNVGFGRHRENISTENYEKFRMATMVLSPAYSFGMGLAKISFAVLYLRINPKRYLVILNKALIVFLACQIAEETFTVIFKCQPIRASWDQDIEGHCLDITVMWKITFAFNIITDLILFIQPIPSVWGLKLPVAKRLGVISMLSLGLLVCIASIARLVYVLRISHNDTYELAEPMIWSQIELATLVLCSCVPCLRQVIQQVPCLSRALGISSNKTTRRSSSSAAQPQLNFALRTYGSSAGRRSSQRYLQSGRHGSGPLSSLTSRAVGRGPSPVESTDEIFLHTTDGNGAILVTRELSRDVESNRASAGDLSTADPVGAYRVRREK